MNTINVENCKTLLIGRRGENEVTTVAFDFTEWASEFGSGVVDLYVKRFGDNSAYPVALTIDGTIATWTVTATDTNVAGYGKAEYVYRVDGKIAKSAVFPFFVAEDIGQPASEPPDPYESWLEQLTALGAETEAHAQAAEQSAENAAESAENAAQSAASAEGYAGQAETAAGLAQAAQTASEAARDAAQTAQASAESSATAASGSAASAAGSATAAAGSASDASASATAAGASASAASASATTASNAATAAQTAQSAAEDAAEDAQQAAQQAHVEYEQLSGEVDDLSDEVTQQKSAIDDLEALTNRKAGMLVDSVSGAIASFVPDATISDLLGVRVAIEPVQDLHGYDSPWPGAGGKNLLDPTTATGSAVTWGGVTLSTDQDSEVVSLSGTAIYNGGRTALVLKTIHLAAGAYYISASSTSGAQPQVVVQTVSGSTYTVIGDRANMSFSLAQDSDIAVGFNLINDTTYASTLKLQVEAGSTATAWSPYKNICPISGWDSVEVDAAGVNLFGGEVSQLAFASYSEGDMIISHATYRSIFARVKSGKTYTVSRKTIEGNRFRVAATVDYPAREVPCRILANDAQQDNALAVTATIPDGYNYIFVYLSNQSDSCTAGNYQIELGSTATDYHPYAGNCYTIALGQTVYGAKLTIAEDGSVNALVDRAAVDMGTLGYSKSSYVQNGFVATSGMPDDFPLAPGSSAIPNWICSNYGNIVSNIAIESASVDYALAWRVAGQNKGIIVKDSNYAGYYTNNDMASFKAAMSGIQLVYELATPIEIQLDPVTISTISGQTSNVWADAGNVTVKFAADLKHYIDSKIAAAVAALS